MEELVKEMQKIGFTAYEAKIYLALLQHNPATGYELSKLSGVPQAKVYETIPRLANMGAVVALATEPARYAPLPPEELLKNLHNAFQQSLDILGEGLPKLMQEKRLEYVWNITGYKATLEKAREMVNRAGNSLLLSIWEQEALCLHNELFRAANRGVEVKVLLYGTAELNALSAVYYHGNEEQLQKQAGGRWLTLVADREEVLVGQVADEEEGVAVWTANPSIVFVSLRYVEHEIYIARKLERSEE